MQDNRSRLLEWIKCDAIANQDISQAIHLIKAQPSAKDWLLFTQKAFVWLAIIAFAAGVIFFFAYNWQDMSRFTKFGLLEGVIVLCALLYVRLSSSETLKPALLTGMALLIGALLALVGQTYQTGADPWQLFAIWSVFVLPLALLGRSCIIWIFTIALINTALLLYIELSRHFLWFDLSGNQFSGLICAVNSALLIVFELAAYFSRHRTNRPFLANRYTQQTLVTIAGVSISMLALSNIGSYKDETNYFFYYLVWLVTVVALYRLFIRDIYILAASALSFIIVSTAFLFDAFEGFDNEGALLLLGFYIIGCSSLATYWLKKLTHSPSEPPTDGNIDRPLADKPAQSDHHE